MNPLNAKQRAGGFPSCGGAGAARHPLTGLMEPPAAPIHSRTAPRAAPRPPAGAASGDPALQESPPSLSGRAPRGRPADPHPADTQGAATSGSSATARARPHSEPRRRKPHGEGKTAVRRTGEREDGPTHLTCRCPPPLAAQRPRWRLPPPLPPRPPYHCRAAARMPRPRPAALAHAQPRGGGARRPAGAGRAVPRGACREL